MTGSLWWWNDSSTFECALVTRDDGYEVDIIIYFKGGMIRIRTYKRDDLSVEFDRVA